MLRCVVCAIVCLLCVGVSAQVCSLSYSCERCVAQGCQWCGQEGYYGGGICATGTLHSPLAPDTCNSRDLCCSASTYKAYLTHSWTISDKTRELREPPVPRALRRPQQVWVCSFSTFLTRYTMTDYCMIAAGSSVVSTNFQFCNRTNSELK